jgi:ABC-type tungstate transport system substrate-binding protein
VVASASRPMVGGNIRGETRVMTTSIVLERRPIVPWFRPTRRR